MALATVHGVVLDGVRGVMVRVEVAVSDGLPSVGIVGLADTAVQEARWRVRGAVESSGRSWPTRRITVSLSPAEMRKHGAGLDLPIAVGVLAAEDSVAPALLDDTALVGELGLDGGVRPSHGMLAAVLAARDAGMARVIVPVEGTADLDVVPGVVVCRAASLADVIAILEGASVGDAPAIDPAAPVAMGSRPVESADLLDVRGHQLARWAIEVAAAGGHHLAMIGPPGVGKTLLAERLPGILPHLAEDAALEVAAIHSIAGLERSRGELTRPPLSAPHHSASAAALLGSTRAGRVVPGAVTLAHRGVLFLDEAAEFVRPALEGLRQPLESGRVALSRTGWSGMLPARFQLVLAANPCPCGLRVGIGAGCSCPPASIRRYAARLSGPLLDRIDIRVTMTRPLQTELESTEVPESSAVVQARVIAARERMQHRLAGSPWTCNAEVPTGPLRRRWVPASDAMVLLRDFERASVNLRGVDRVLRMAWTLADLAGAERPQADHVAGALGLRGAHTGLAS